MESLRQRISLFFLRDSRICEHRKKLQNTVHRIGLFGHKNANFFSGLWARVRIDTTVWAALLVSCHSSFFPGTPCHMGTDRSSASSHRSNLILSDFQLVAGLQSSPRCQPSRGFSSRSHNKITLDRLSMLMAFYPQMSPKTYSTGDAAKAVGISRATLQAWIASRKIDAPKAQDLGKIRVRLWSESDVARLRRAKENIYMKQLGRPRKNKKK
jgi:predicted DNA-binding transcriptional regulator AlpA